MGIRTELREELKRKNKRIDDLFAEVARLQDALKLATHQLNVEKGANKAHVANLQALIESSDKQTRIRENTVLQLLAERDQLRIKADAMHLVIVPLSVKADISEEELLSLLAKAKQGMGQAVRA